MKDEMDADLTKWKPIGSRCMAAVIVLALITYNYEKFTFYDSLITHPSDH